MSVQAHAAAKLNASVPGGMLADQFLRADRRPGSWTDSMTVAGVVMHFAQGQEIFCEGAEAESFFKVSAGCVRICKYLASGRRQIEAFYGPGEIFGLEAGETYRLSAEAVSECTVIAFRRHALQADAPNGPLFQALFFHAMGDAARAQEHSLLLGRSCAVDKVAIFLAQRAERTAAGWAVTLPMSRYDVADYLGLTVETVSRVLSKMERDGLIKLTTARMIAIRNLTALQPDED